MNEHFGVKLEDIFNSMSNRFRPEGAEGIDGSIGYKIKGAGSWILTIEEMRMNLTTEDNLSNCDVIINADSKTFIGISVGKIDANEAFNSRKLIIDGDMNLFSQTARFFTKYVVPGLEEDLQEEELLVLNKTISVKQTFSTGPVMGKFLKALKDKKILAIRCPECGRLQSPPREVCAICRVRNDEWVEIGPNGSMRMLEYCFYASPDPLTAESRETPYGAIGILLDGCRDEEVFWHLLHPDQLDRVKMGIVINGEVREGSRVRPVWSENRTGSIDDIKYFEIDE